MTEPLISIESLSRRLDIPVKTLRDWRYKGLGPPSLAAGRHVRYRPEQIEAWLQSLEVTGGDAA